MSQSEPSRHVALLIEIPAIYTADLDELREFDFSDEFRSPEERESDFLLNCCGEPSIVRLRMEISGEKDSTIVEAWGSVLRAELVEPSRGYDAGANLTDEQLAKHGWKLMREKFDGGCEWCSLPDLPEED
jgi:hypothetical protein